MTSWALLLCVIFAVVMAPILVVALGLAYLELVGPLLNVLSR